MSEKVNYLTAQGYAKLKEELDILVRTRRKEIASRIQEAKELGDLSENAEYQEAKNEQAFNEGRIEELENIVKHAQIITPENNGHDVVAVGSTVEAEQGDQRLTFVIVGSNEADPLQGKISNESPLGKALLGRRVNDQVTTDTPRGQISYKITKVK